MFKVVIDTNVIVSAALSELGKPAKIVNLALDKVISPFYSQQIMNEYIKVLARPHFKISSEKRQYLIDGIEMVGSLYAPKVSNIPLPDKNDRVFYDLATEVGAIIITGNTKHYPAEKFIMTPNEFLSLI